MPRIAYYVDSHGFGHSTRSMALVESFPPDWEVVFRTNAPEWLFRAELDRPFDFLPSPLDIHPRHSTGYRIDPAATYESARRKMDRSDELIREEADWIRRSEIHLVLSDISPLAIAAGDLAGVPSCGISNFTWDWIFEPFLRDLDSEGMIDRMREMIGRATMNFRLPFSSPDTFPGGSIECPLLVRPTRMGREQARAWFGFESDIQYVLLTFGGIEGNVDSIRSLERYAPVQFVKVVSNGADRPAEPIAPRLDRLPHCPNLWGLDAPGLYHPDLVSGVDGVLTKPGYGILSECVSTAKPMMLDARPDFREYEVVRRTLDSFPQVRFLPPGTMDQFDLGSSISDWLSAPPKLWPDSMDGADHITATLQNIL